MLKIDNRILIIVAIIILASFTYASTLMHNSGLFVASLAVVLLGAWFLFMSLCVMICDRVLA